MREYKIYYGGEHTSVNFDKFIYEVANAINENEYIISECKKCNIEFMEKISSFPGDPEYFGRFVTTALFKCHRFAYLKNLSYNDKIYVAEIDCINRSFVLVEE